MAARAGVRWRTPLSAMANPKPLRKATARPALPKAPTPAPALDDLRIGQEARAAQDDHLAVKVWLRMLSTSNQVEQAIRARLRERFGTTLARFDYLAQLERHAGGLRMSALSRYLMVTSGNVTGLTDQLVEEGLVERKPDPDDGRSWLVRLTPKGRREFGVMAAEHEAWLKAMFSGYDHTQMQQLYELLGRLRLHLATGSEQSAT